MLKTIYTACRTCYSADTPYEIYNSTDDEEKMLKLREELLAAEEDRLHGDIGYSIEEVGMMMQAAIEGVADGGKE